ncbi:MAG: PfkB family carbohydrate kinase [Hyphomicrobium sp.]
MAKILVISSFLAHGAIGLGVINPAFRALGHTIFAVPAVVLSNHPRHVHVAKAEIPPDALSRMIAALDGNGWLEDLDAVLTGYLPSSAHVSAARDAVLLVRRRSPMAIYVCDPVLGDDPDGLYIAADAAAAIRDRLLPIASAATPNRFELAWLTGEPVTTPAEAVGAALRLGPAVVAATSIPQGESELATLLVAGTETLEATVAKRARVPHGTGDLFAAVLTGLLAEGQPRAAAFETAHRIVDQVVVLSAGQDDLDLSPLTGLRSMP